MKKQHHAYTLKCDDQYHRLDLNIVLSHKFLEEFKQSCLEHPLKHEFCIEEDKFLLFIEHRGKINDDEEKRSTPSELVQEYREERKKNAQVFNKPDVDGSRLKERLNSLKEMGLRYQILYAQVNEEIEKIKEELEKEKTEEEKLLKLKKQREKKSNIPKSINRAQSSVYIDPSHKNASIRVDITVSGKNFGPATLRSREKYLIEASPVIKKILEDPVTKIAVDENDEKFKQIAFSENDKQYKDLKLYDCFHPETFKKFLLFSENPNLKQKYNLILDKQEEVNAENENNINDAVNKLNEIKIKHLKRFEENIRRYKAELEQTMEKCKEFDMEKLRLLYEVHKYNELDKVDKLFEARKKEVDLFFDEEIRKTKELFSKQQTTRRNQISGDLVKYEKLLNEIFPKETLVSLLILADLLQATELKNSCIKAMTENFEIHLYHEALGARMMTETMAEILAQLPVQKLKDLKNSYGFHFSRAMVEKEIEYRKGMLADEFRDKTVEDLMELTKKGCVFPDVLESEIEKRKNKKPYVSLNTERCSPFLSIDDDFVTVHLKGQKRYSTVHATHSLNYKGWAKWYFEVLIEQFDESFGSSISIGWDVDRSSCDGPIIGLTPGNRNQFGYSWQSDGLLHHYGKGMFIGTKFGAGDVIGCGINQTKKKLTFYKNGEKIILIKKESNRRIQEIKSIAIQDDFYELFPAACLYSTKKNSDCTIRFNFSGPFINQPKHYEPYGDQRQILKQQKQIKELE
ncbi:hypothetical protein C9374_009911 [Naegleria lovaniensis]|uniref:B30.2/SPRY domain-containing protein n=1 Tax=Naegleria lovaniensis TaxID=51637 RepID=A0AA88KES8_NAELO|nr:uncharacterized protein C9374_009911 [Naegleria lovaniensis]KAG2375288.1 hypothetical protein C9374_009911 [Naegleria lovaniensis]